MMRGLKQIKMGQPLLSSSTQKTEIAVTSLKTRRQGELEVLYLISGLRINCLSNAKR